MKQTLRKVAGGVNEPDAIASLNFSQKHILNEG